MLYTGLNKKKITQTFCREPNYLAIKTSFLKGAMRGKAMNSYIENVNGYTFFVLYCMS